MAKPADSNRHQRPLFDRRFRGYDAAAVDEFLDRVLKEAGQLQEELVALRAERDKCSHENAALVEQCSRLGAELGRLSATIQDNDDTILRLKAENAALHSRMTSADEVLRTAHEAAEKMTQETQQRCRQMVEDAENRSARILDEMRQKLHALREQQDAARLDFRRFLHESKRLAENALRALEERSELDLG